MSRSRGRAHCGEVLTAWPWARALIGGPDAWTRPRKPCVNMMEDKAVRRSRRQGGHRGMHDRPRGHRAGLCRRQAPSFPCPPVRTTSGPMTAIRAPTPAAWAPSLPAPTIPPELAQRSAWTTIFLPTVKALECGGQNLPGRALLRHDAHPQGPQGGGVQRPVRRSRVPGGAESAGNRPDGHSGGLRGRNPQIR